MSMLQYGADAAWVNVDGTSLLDYVVEDEGGMERQWLVDALVMYGAS
jgi:hypothetical protein